MNNATQYVRSLAISPQKTPLVAPRLGVRAPFSRWFALVLALACVMLAALSASPATAKDLKYYDRCVAIFDDSPQLKISWEVRNVGFIRTKVPITYKKMLRHCLRLTITGLDRAQAVKAFKRCFEQASISGALSGIATTYLSGGGGWAAGVATFTAEINGCMTSKSKTALNVDFNNKSHWLDWRKI